MRIQDPETVVERALEVYAAAIRREEAAKKALDKAAAEDNDARLARQEYWREIKSLMGQGKILPGLYMVRSAAPNDTEGILLDPLRDYPPIVPCFRGYIP